MQITDVRTRAVPILKRRAVRRAGVFGSVARGEVARDVDLLVEVPRPYGFFSFLSLKQELEDALGTKVDLIEYSMLKPALRERILSDEITLL
ncbi:MAG: nucleotidyltransferase family protein [Minisyncoccota bacterium]